jgi:hypothetical protein
LPPTFKWTNYIPKTSSICIKNYEKEKLWKPHVPLLVHLGVHPWSFMVSLKLPLFCSFQTVHIHPKKSFWCLGLISITCTNFMMFQALVFSSSIYVSYLENPTLGLLKLFLPINKVLCPNGVFHNYAFWIIINCSRHFAFTSSKYINGIVCLYVGYTMRKTGVLQLALQLIIFTCCEC